MSTVNDTTDVIISPNPSIEVTKTVSVTDTNGNSNDPGDVLRYTITIENTGNVTVTSTSLVDTPTDNNGNVLSLDSGTTYLSASAGSTSVTIKSGGIVTYTATYALTTPAFSGKIKNTVLATASSPGNSGDVQSQSDGDDTDFSIK